LRKEDGNEGKARGCGKKMEMKEEEAPNLDEERCTMRNAYAPIASAYTSSLLK
jgi:hypothetical protein